MTYQDLEKPITLKQFKEADEICIHENTMYAGYNKPIRAAHIKHYFRYNKVWNTAEERIKNYERNKLIIDTDWFTVQEEDNVNKTIDYINQSIENGATVQIDTKQSLKGFKTSKYIKKYHKKDSIESICKNFNKIL